MPSEIEAKMRLTDPQTMRKRLREHGGRQLGQVLEVNRYFDWPDGRLRQNDCGLRIRRKTPLEPAGAETPPSASVTYKGPRRPGQLKIREEIEFTADQADMAEAFLEALGLVATVSFEKRRESWQWGNCQVELDELPRLGWFMEIEGPDEQSVHRARTSLSMQDEPLEMASYLAIIQLYRKQQGLQGTHFGF